MIEFLERLSQSISETSTLGYVVVLVIAVTLFCVTASSAFKYLIKARTLEDVPTSKARSAEQGYVELEGHGEMLDGEPIISPLSKVKCLWWSYVIEEQSGNDWRSIQKKQSDSIFGLRDDTGMCIVDPEGAEVFPLHKKVWKSHEKLFKTVSKTGKILDKLPNTRKYRYRESFLYPHEWLCVIGNFKTHTAIEDWDDSVELTNLLAQWKKDQAKLLERFDLNDDGEIDGQEWEAARQAARKYLDQEKRELAVKPGVHVIAAPADKRPFLIAPLNNSHFAKKLRKKAIWSCLGIVVSSMFLALVLHARFGE